MERTKKLLQKIDLAGAPLSHTVEGNGTSYKSAKGGLLSILIIILSLSYTIYILYLWNDNKILPKIQVSQLQVDYSEFKMNEQTISFVFQTSSQNPINPFQQDQIILIPIVNISSNSNFAMNGNILLDESLPYEQIIRLGQIKQENTSDSKTSLNTGKSKSVSTSQSSSKSQSKSSGMDESNSEGNILVFNQNQFNTKNKYKNDSQILVNFLQCSPNLLKENQTCANQSVQDNYFSAPSKKIYMKLHFETFDGDTLQFFPKSKNYKFLIDEHQSLYNQVVFQTKQLCVYHGFLFQDKINKTFLNSVNIQTQTISFNQSKQLFGQVSYATFLISLDSEVDYEQRSYTSLGEVGAQIGSIVNLIMMIKLLIIYNNTKEYQSKLIKVIISSSSQDPQNDDQEKDQIKSTEAERESALAKTNIFHIHSELARLRVILDQIVAKKDTQYQNVSQRSSIGDESQLKGVVQDQQIGQSRSVLYRDKDQSDSWQIFQYEIQQKRDNLTKQPDKIIQPDKSKQIELMLVNRNRKSTALQEDFSR